LWLIVDHPKNNCCQLLVIVDVQTRHPITIIYTIFHKNEKILKIFADSFGNIKKKYYLCRIKSIGKIQRIRKKSFGKIQRIQKKSFEKIQKIC